MARLIIRADAGPRMGAGHVMRCFALAQAAVDLGVEVHLVGRVGVSWVLERLALAAVKVTQVSGETPSCESPHDLLNQIAQVSGCPEGTWVVLDGYHFTPQCQQAVMQAGYHLLVVDDYAHLSSYHCDILLNQNLGAEHLAYRGEIGQKLLGPEYALLRPEFRKARNLLRDKSALASPSRILVSLGGGNFIDDLASVAAAMNIPEMAGKKVQVISGAMDVARINELFSACPAEVSVLGRVDDMPALLLATDLCITAGGSTCWELCCLGVPFLTVVVAQNQQKVVAALDDLDVAKPFSKDSLLAMLAGYIGQRFDLVDGQGAERIVVRCLQNNVINND